MFYIIFKKSNELNLRSWLSKRLLSVDQKLRTSTVHPADVSLMFGSPGRVPRKLQAKIIRYASTCHGPLTLISMNLSSLPILYACLFLLPKLLRLYTGMYQPSTKLAPFLWHNVPIFSPAPRRSFIASLFILPFYFQPTEDARLIQSFEGGEYRMLQRWGYHHICKTHRYLWTTKLS